MLLHLGVVDIPYVERPPAKRAPKNPGARRRPRPHKRHGAKYRGVTTGDVAGWLEGRYHVMEHFFELHGQEIADDFASSLSGAVESLFMGGPVDLDPHGAATSRVEDRFKQMLSTRELDAIGYPGIPTAAAQAGVSHRHKSGRTKGGAARPSFVDTGLYQASFKAWVE